MRRPWRPRPRKHRRSASVSHQHGYNINNYLAIDTRFGTKEDLVELVQAAHARTQPIRVIHDVVINHSGDNWHYPGDVAWYYANDEKFPFAENRDIRESK